jgi:hypothetical protein
MWQYCFRKRDHDCVLSLTFQGEAEHCELFQTTCRSDPRLWRLRSILYCQCCEFQLEVTYKPVSRAALSRSTFVGYRVFAYRSLRTSC